MPVKTVIRCIGNVRGWCGKNHYTMHAACRCFTMEMVKCAELGLTTDRRCIRVMVDTDKQMTHHADESNPEESR